MRELSGQRWVLLFLVLIRDARGAPAGAAGPQKEVEDAIDSYAMTHEQIRSYLQIDKPIYEAGETIHLRANLVAADTLAGVSADLYARLNDARGQRVGEVKVPVVRGVGSADFVLAAGAAGGEYTLTLDGKGIHDQRTLIVASYEAPRLKKTLELTRKAYGPGDVVTAAFSVARATGEPLAHQQVIAQIDVGGQAKLALPFVTDAGGAALITMTLPANLTSEDATLSVLVTDGGVSEPIQRPIPVVLAQVDLAFFPEGGDLVAGVPGRVYFAAHRKNGKPADVEGRVVDEDGNLVAMFASTHAGMGRFDITPAAGHTYRAEVARPTLIQEVFELPAVTPTGCVLRSRSEKNDSGARFTVACADAHTLLVEAMLAGRRVVGAQVAVSPGHASPVDLAIPAASQGLLRVTVFDEQKAPLAERLVYVGHGRDLGIRITADKQSYSPRDKVTLTVKTTDRRGRPIAANVGLAVVDDTVLSYADDKHANLLAHVFLEGELGPLTADDDPNFYFAATHGAAPGDADAALDLLVATRGWRHFNWQMVLKQAFRRVTNRDGATPTTGAITGTVIDSARGAPLLLTTVVVKSADLQGTQSEFTDDAGKYQIDRLPPGHYDVLFVYGDSRVERFGVDVIAGKVATVDAALDLSGSAEVITIRERAPTIDLGSTKEGVTIDQEYLKNVPTFGRSYQALLDAEGGAQSDAFGVSFSSSTTIENTYVVELEPVRVRAPRPARAPANPRSDFRQTVDWAAAVQTGADGTAKVSFTLSDAVTSFRAVAEGFGGGLAGRGEAVLGSRLPVSLDARLPLEVSAGDEIRLPVTVANETDHPMTALLDARFGEAFVPGVNPAPGPFTLAAGARRTFFFPLAVTGAGNQGKVRIDLTVPGTDLADAIEKTIPVASLGFPFTLSDAGTAEADDAVTSEVDLDGAIPGTMHAHVSLYPSPIAAMTGGSAGMLRQPSGCFEQASSTNYPNVMLLGYLGAHATTLDPKIVETANQALEVGYKLLTGYETKERGYEWFGGTPGHEALTAYALMEFADMQKVYPAVDPEMIERTAAWLTSRRDGHGGFERNPRALDSFGGAGPETTTAYIMWSLAETHRTAGMNAELDGQRELGRASTDPYLVALAANTLLLTEPTGADTRATVERLVAMQGKKGRFTGAKESITRSGGDSLDEESTALALLALVKAADAGMHVEEPLRSATDWLNDHRRGEGSWASTQATVLALKAMTSADIHNRVIAADGTAVLAVNGREVGKVKFGKGQNSVISFDVDNAFLHPGKNVFSVRLEPDTSSLKMPFPSAWIVVPIGHSRRRRPRSRSRPRSITITWRWANSSACTPTSRTPPTPACR